MSFENLAEVYQEALVSAGLVDAEKDALSTKIMEKRLQERITYTALAEKTYLPVNMIQRIEAGDYMVPVEHYRLVHAALATN